MKNLSVKLDREKVRRYGFKAFIPIAWHLVEPSPYVHGEHITQMANACQAVTEDRLDDLVVNVPPGHSKSLVMSVLWPAWSWIERPWLRWLCYSFDGSLALRDAERMFDLIASPWFVERWGRLLPEDKSVFAMGDFSNSQGGLRFSSSVGGKGTGRHGHVRLVDDPHKPSDLVGATKAVTAALSNTNFWWKNTMGSRRADPKYFKSVVVMQRLHQGDLSQQCLDEGSSHLELPMHFDSKRACKLLDKTGAPVAADWRTADKELLNPERFDAKAVAALEKSMGAETAAGQLEMCPAPPDGLLFKEDTFGRFTLQQVSFSSTFSVISVDCTFKDAATSDNVALEVWGTLNGKFYLFESVLAKLDLEGTVRAALAMLERNTGVNAVLIEDKANGPEVIKALRKRLPNVLAVDPKTSKYARAQSANVLYQARSVFHLADAAWLARKEMSLKFFPKSRFGDDDVDSTSQALLYLESTSMSSWVSAMKQAQKDIRTGAFSQHFVLR